ncbi:hypothetical protein F9L16_09905 [Agarivorans sp. B2Z047]|uniref:hypothetical protein n=1 Tax=Agarivorans sp. B2Z047 TaxID=2652721 RepID=UPI00128B805F|nr:hypothetical protein [Agarivorans sp. B2Z047]MPW29311.1 hypothetical protein [Agarivorans sp. B2Z047]UQN44898.1 hypothetical protein LQZ07_10665 [Agarivorans sp. B2Z047]
MSQKTYRNKVSRISLAGGLIGMLTTNPRRALDEEVKDLNDQGWKATHIQPHKTSNMFIAMLQTLTLLITFGLWTFGAGYLILAEKES